MSTCTPQVWAWVRWRSRWPSNILPTRAARVISVKPTNKVIYIIRQVSDHVLIAGVHAPNGLGEPRNASMPAYFHLCARRLVMIAFSAMQVSKGCCKLALPNGQWPLQALPRFPAYSLSRTSSTSNEREDASIITQVGQVICSRRTSTQQESSLVVPHLDGTETNACASGLATQGPMLCESPVGHCNEACGQPDWQMHIPVLSTLRERLHTPPENFCWILKASNWDEEHCVGVQALTPSVR